MTQIDHSDVLAQTAFDRRRTARMIVPILLGAVILTAATEVCGRVRTESGSSLVLTGVIAYTDPTQGFAIIGSTPRNTYLARPGQQLPDGSRIREIHPKHVVLENGGSLQTVALYAPERNPGAAYVQFPAPGQPARWEEPELMGIPARQVLPSQGMPTQAIPGQGVPTLGMPTLGMPNQARSIDLPPGHPRPGDPRSNEAPVSEMRINDGSSNNALPRRAQPDLPLPTTQEPVDEFNDYRRQRTDAIRE